MIEKLHGGGIIDQQGGIILRRKRANCSCAVLSGLNLERHPILAHHPRPYLGCRPILTLALNGGSKSEIHWSLIIWQICEKHLLAVAPSVGLRPYKPDNTRKRIELCP